MRINFTDRLGTFCLIVLLLGSVLYTILGVFLWGVGPFTAGLVAGAITLSAAVHVGYLSPSERIDWTVPWMLCGLSIAVSSTALASITSNDLFRSLATGGYILTALIGLAYWLYNVGVVADEWPSVISDKLPERADNE